MHRHRSLIVVLCLLALVWCQVAMAAQACHGGVPGTTSAMDCHGDSTDTPAGDAPDCPGSQVTPDLAKAPTVAALLPGHDFGVAPAMLRIGFGPSARTACPRDGPDLDALCRLLI